MLPQTRCSSFHGVKNFSHQDGMKLFKNIRTYGWAVLPQHGPVLFTLLKNFSIWMLCSHLTHSSWWLDRAPQHPLSRPSSFCGVKKSFRFDVMQTFNNVQMNGRSCSLKTRSRAFHGVEEPFRLDEMQLFKNIRTDGWVVLPQTRPCSVHGVEKTVCMDVLQPCKNIQVYGWAALPNIPCHGLAHFAALKTRFVL